MREQLYDDKFLYNYLGLTPSLEEEFNKENPNIDNFNMAVLEEELL